MSAATTYAPPRRLFSLPSLDTLGAWLLAIVWISPLVFAVWAAFHTPEGALSFKLNAPLTVENFRVAWDAAPWPRYFLNTTLLVTVILIGQLTL